MTAMKDAMNQAAAAVVVLSILWMYTLLSFTQWFGVVTFGIIAWNGWQWLYASKTLGFGDPDNKKEKEEVEMDLPDAKEQLIESTENRIDGMIRQPQQSGANSMHTKHRLCIRSLSSSESKKDTTGGDFILPNTGPLKIENDFFKGEFLFLLKWNNDPNFERWRDLFEGKRFKQKPDGIVYMGGEVPSPMNLNMFTKSLTKLLLGIVKSLVPGLHYSFGDKPRDNDLPHLSFPLFNAVDQFVVTKPGDTPPDLGLSNFGESEEERRQRKKAKATPFDYNTEDIYSFQFHSLFIDFIKWKVVNVPGFRDMSLQNFWDDMPLRVCCYAVPLECTSHSHDIRKYFFSFELKYDDSIEEQSIKTLNEVSESSDAKSTSSTRGGSVEDLSNASSMKHVRFSIPIWLEYYNSSDETRHIAYVFKIDREKNPTSPLSSEAQTRVTFHSPINSIAPILNTKDKAKTKSKLENCHLIDAERREIESHLRAVQISGSIGTKYVLYQLLMSSDTISDDFMNNFGRRSPDDLNIRVKPPREGSPTILLQSEILHVLWNSHYRHEWAVLTETHIYFYRSCSSLPSLVVDVSDILAIREHTTSIFTGFYFIEIECLECIHCIAMGSLDMQSKWISRLKPLLNPDHIVARLNASALSFVHARSSALKFFDFPLKYKYGKRKLINTRRCHSFRLPGPNRRRKSSQAIAIDLHEHLGSLLNEVLSADMKKWKVKDLIDFLNKISDLQNTELHALLRSKMTSEERTSQSSDSPTKPSPFMFASPSLTDDIYGGGSGGSANHGDSTNRRSESDMSFTENEVVGGEGTWTSYPDEGSETSLVVQRGLMSYFLNLYHFIIMVHDLMGLLPRSWSDWLSFFKEASVEINDMAFSLAEIEHCILRNAMCKPRSTAAKLLIPRFQEMDPRYVFRLRIKDSRLNFALNCMSYSCPARIVVYDPNEQVQDLQLSQNATDFLMDVIRVDMDKVCVYLPKICDWYREDFDTSSLEMLKQICYNWLKPPLDQKIGAILARNKLLHVKYLNYDFHCRSALNSPVDVHVVSNEMDSDMYDQLVRNHD